MRSVLALSVLAFAGLSLTQDGTYPYTIDPNSVSSTDRQTWCDNQKAQCPLICLQQPGVTSLTTVQNDCDPDTLVYSCVCENNVAPNITQYSQTIPYYVCTEWGNQCVAACGDNTCKDACRADHPCGAQHPNPPNSSAITTTSQTASATATGDDTSIPTSGLLGQTGSPDSAAGVVSPFLGFGQSYGLAVVFMSVFAGFAIIL
ncbi:hypothetical protein K491DRAFT_721769 [Lophiostoma macrostomum CBS 122681]|uniref:DUF7707 domain-containing protein n=1 Tax=Lophiostoma macrostomum CBS 122681 TaxID=1314788 RepID=A0A6A6SSD7_9PLEO|nr:hypothetical protein K491DRAFT_721769 [Lophiostoma macrostomum CBS 122681]